MMVDANTQSVAPTALQEKKRSSTTALATAIVVIVGAVIIFAGALKYYSSDDEDDVTPGNKTVQKIEHMVFKQYPKIRPKLGERWRVHNSMDYYISAKVGANSAFTPPEIPPGEDWILRIEKLCGTPPFYVRVKEGDDVRLVTLTLEK